VVGEAHFLREWQLGRDAGPNLCLGQAVALHRSHDLRRLVGGDDDQGAERFGEAHLDEKRHLVAGERLPPERELCRALALEVPNARMRDALESQARLRNLEDVPAEAAPVELPSCVEHPGAERCDDLGEAGRAGANDLAREVVRVEDRDAASDEAGGDHALARGEAAGEAEDMHEVARSLPFPEHPFKWGMRFGTPRRLGTAFAVSVAALGCAGTAPAPRSAGPDPTASNAEPHARLAPSAPEARASCDFPAALVAWSYRAGAPLAAPPGLGSDGSVVVGSVDGYLHALRGDGSFRWGYTLRGPVVGRPAMGPHGAVFAAADPNGLYALDGEGTLLWVSSVAGGVSSPAVIDRSSKVWVATGQGTLLGFSSHGGLVGFARIGTAPTLGPTPLPGGGVVVASADGKLRILGGESSARRAIASSLVDLEVGRDALFLLGAEGLSRLDAADGEERWSRTSVERLACASPALVVVEAQGLRWLSSEGEPRARVPLPVGEHRAVACLGDGSLIVADDGGTLLRVDAGGVRARAQLPAGRLLSLDAAQGGLLIAGYRDGRVLAVRPPG